MTFGYPKRLMSLLFISTVQSTQNKYCTVCCMLFLCRLPNRFFKTPPMDVRILHRPSKITCGHIKIVLPKGNSLKIVTHWHCLMIPWYRRFHDKLYTKNRIKKYKTLAHFSLKNHGISILVVWRSSFEPCFVKKQIQNPQASMVIFASAKSCRGVGGPVTSRWDSADSPWCSLGLRLSPI